MKVERDSIIIESRREIETLQDILETFISVSVCAGEEEDRKLAKELSGKLEGMMYSW